MDFLKKVNNFNQYISFHIFAFAGWTTLFLNLHYQIIHTQELKKYGGADCSDGMVVIFYVQIALISAIFILTLIVFLLEQGLDFKIKNKFLVENKILKTMRYIGATISLIHLSYFFGSIFFGFLSMFF